MSPGNTYFEGGIWHNIERGMPDLYKTAMGLNPTRRMGTPQEVAAGVIFLASPVKSRISGTNLIIDGALTKAVSGKAVGISENWQTEYNRSLPIRLRRKWTSYPSAH